LGKGEIVSCSSSHYDWSSNFVFQWLSVGTVESADKGDNLGGSRAIIDWAGKNDSVSVLHLAEDCLKVISEMAFPSLCASSAAIARLNLLSGQTDEFRFNAFLCYFLESYSSQNFRVSPRPCAANDTYDLQA
jgi:hypothetical protein